MRNPWIDLPETAPFVLACDKQAIFDFNHTAKPEHKIHLELLPEPYAGNPEAKIVLLNLNPGFYERNEQFLLGDKHFFNASRANLTHTKQAYPFYHLDPRNAASPGYYWWSRKLKPLIDLYGLKKVAHEMCVVEYFPYHSVNFGCTIFIPSQGYNVYLVKEGLKRNALIIQMRSRRVWQSVVPGLGSYLNYYELKNPRNPTISANNCPSGFPEILKVLG
jgi:hypothetical protein